MRLFLFVHSITRVSTFAMIKLVFVRSQNYLEDNLDFKV